ncbi:MAG: glycosyltransferase family 4 protein [Deltaproteobacteria bacterium]|nr:glycosyltransferase family 4 protein [Deltaproteobacteria bacterium]
MIDKPKEVFIISKPIVPPWNDSGKNIAKELVTHGSRYRYRVLTTQDFAFPHMADNVGYERIYPSGGTYQAGIRQNLKVMWTGLRKKDARIYHYFFAPNRVSATAGRIQQTIARVKTVQTFSSRPADYSRIKDLIFTDKVIVLSEHTRQCLLDAGVDATRMVHIPPGITPPAPLSDMERGELERKYALGHKRMILFPGDFEFSDAAQQVAAAAPHILAASEDAVVVFACRAKTERSEAHRSRIKKELATFGDRVRFYDEINDMSRFVGLATQVILPQNDLYAKMDIPLVLLEAMAHRVPLIVADAGPLRELIAGDAALGSTDATQLAEAAVRLLNTPEVGAELGNGGRRLVDTRYNSLSMAKAIETLYDELLENQ